MDFSDKTVLVVDYGLFANLAQRLVRDGWRKIYYFNPQQYSAFPMSQSAWVGYGIPGVTQVDPDEFWAIAPGVDLAIFPEIYMPDLQQHLVDLGVRVFGNRDAERLETDREFCLNWQVENGLLVPETTIITGIDALKAYLKDTEDVWIKISFYRGDNETQHWVNWDISHLWLEEMEEGLGLQAEEQEFFVCESIDPAIEAGIDTYCIDGQLPGKILTGFEIKDCGYLGKFVDAQDVAEPLKPINEKLQEFFNQNGSRGFFSTEVRVTPERDAYLIDPCIRMPSPPGQIELEAYLNLSEILWEGANGVMVEPELAGIYVGEAMLHTGMSSRNKWLYIQHPPELEQWVKVSNLAMKDGKQYYVPQIKDLREVGAIVAFGDSYEEVIYKLKDMASQVRAYETEIVVDHLDEAMDIISKGIEYGVDIR